MPQFVRPVGCDLPAWERSVRLRRALSGIRIFGVLVLVAGTILAVYVIATILWIMTSQTGII